MPRKKPITIPVRPNSGNPAYHKLAKVLKPIFMRILTEKSTIFARPTIPQ